MQHPVHAHLEHLYRTADHAAHRAREFRRSLSEGARAADAQPALFIAAAQRAENACYNPAAPA